MRITPIANNSYNQNFRASQYTANIIPSRRTDLSRGEKISICATSLALSGMAIGLIALTKKCKKNPIEIFKNQLAKLQKKHPKKDPIVKKLKGQRGVDAVAEYNKMLAKKKVTSLEQKFVNGEIKNKGPKELNYIVRNKTRLERVANY